MALIKSQADIENLRIAGKLHARILQDLKKMAVPGISTKELDEYATDEIMKAGDTPSFLNYKPEGVFTPYPAALCVSVNDEIVHGIPNDRPPDSPDPAPACPAATATGPAGMSKGRTPDRRCANPA